MEKGGRGEGVRGWSEGDAAGGEESICGEIPEGDTLEMKWTDGDLRSLLSWWTEHGEGQLKQPSNGQKERVTC